MTKIDLITGFLGSGKTTLLKKYAEYLIDIGERICILEFDYGAVNVDMMLLQDFNDKCDLEMVSGGCDYECHIRRFKTKLIAMGMKHYDRIIIEPSGIFDPVELFDVLNEEPLGSWYEMGSIISVVDPTNFELSMQSKGILATQLSYAGLIYLSKCQKISKSKINEFTRTIQGLVGQFGLYIDDNKILSTPIDDLSELDYQRIKQSSYEEIGAKMPNIMLDNSFNSVYVLDKNLSIDKVNKISKKLFNDPSYGEVLRVKGFIKENDKWYEYNKTRFENNVTEIENGQDVIIIIGENLNENAINGLFIN
mgnify:CR=1 FL=1